MKQKKIIAGKMNRISLNSGTNSGDKIKYKYKYNLNVYVFKALQREKKEVAEQEN